MGVSRMRRVATLMLLLLVLSLLPRARADDDENSTIVLDAEGKAIHPIYVNLGTGNGGTFTTISNDRPIQDISPFYLSGWHPGASDTPTFQCTGTETPARDALVALDGTGSTCYVNPVSQQDPQSQSLLGVIWFGTVPKLSDTDEAENLYAYWVVFREGVDPTSVFPRPCNQDGICSCGTSFDSIRSGWNAAGATPLSYDACSNANEDNEDGTPASPLRSCGALWPRIIADNNCALNGILTLPTDGLNKTFGIAPFTLFRNTTDMPSVSPTSAPTVVPPTAAPSPSSAAAVARGGFASCLIGVTVVLSARLR